MSFKILIVEDDLKLRNGLADNFRFEGYVTTSAPNAEIGEKVWIENSPDLVILDLMLPGKSGYDLLRKMRSLGFGNPVIILSALGEEWDKVKGFQSGCDDYVCKPFSLLELLERVKANLKRSINNNQPAEAIELDELSLRITERKITIDGDEFPLTERQMLVLYYFMRNVGRVITRKELLEKVWMMSPEADTRTIDVHISGLRKLIRGSAYSIETVFKSGYLFDRADSTLRNHI